MGRYWDEQRGRWIQTKPPSEETPVTQPTPAVTNTKAWVALIGSLLTAALPMIGQIAGWLPPPYGLILSGIGTIIAAITGKTTHQVSYFKKQ